MQHGKYYGSVVGVALEEGRYFWLSEKLSGVEECVCQLIKTTEVIIEGTVNNAACQCTSLS